MKKNLRICRPTDLNGDLDVKEKDLYENAAVCIFTDDRPPQTRSNDVLTFTINGRSFSALSRASGSKKGHLIVYNQILTENGLSSFLNKEVEVEIKASSPEDFAEWAEKTADPKTQLLAHFYRSQIALTSSVLAEALELRREAKFDKIIGFVIGLLGFVLGTFFDTALVRRVTGWDAPDSSVIAIALALITLVCVLAINRGSSKR